MAFDGPAEEGSALWAPTANLARMTDGSTPREFYAKTYDASVADWPGELDFYLALARKATGELLELAAGTGRIAIRLAEAGYHVTGLDHSAEMLDVARARSTHLPNMRWIEADVRTFDVGRQFGLIIIPGHSFQNLLTADDQIACLRRVAAHLAPGGRFVVHLDHQDVDWLGAISPGGTLAGVFEPAEAFVHPETGRTVRPSQAWTYLRSDQAALLSTRWEELDDAGTAVATVEDGPTPIHCVFPYEMEHLLGRAGFTIKALYGDFKGSELTDRSTEMLWMAQIR